MNFLGFMCNEKIDLFWQHLLPQRGSAPPGQQPDTLPAGQDDRPEPPEKPTDDVDNATQRYEIKNDNPRCGAAQKTILSPNQHGDKKIFSSIGSMKHSVSQSLSTRCLARAEFCIMLGAVARH